MRFSPTGPLRIGEMVAPLPGYVSNFVQCTGTGFSASLGGCPGDALRRLGPLAQESEGREGFPVSILEYDPEKWEPVFGKDHAQSKS